MSTGREPRHSDLAVVLAPVAIALIIAGIALNDTALPQSEHPEFYGAGWRYVGIPGIVIGVFAILLDLWHLSKKNSRHDGGSAVAKGDRPDRGDMPPEAPRTER